MKISPPLAVMAIVIIGVIAGTWNHKIKPSTDPNEIRLSPELLLKLSAQAKKQSEKLGKSVSVEQVVEDLLLKSNSNEN